MVNKLRNLFGGLVLATSIAFSGTNDLQFASTNNFSSAEEKAPQITSLNTLYTNNIPYLEIKGKIYKGDLKKYFLQYATDLGSNSWQDVSSLDDLADKKKEEFYYSKPLEDRRGFFKIRKSK